MATDKRPCARCGWRAGVNRYSPPELDGYFIRLCHGCLNATKAERRMAMARVHSADHVYVWPPEGNCEAED